MLSYARSVFINCPFDKDYAPILEAMLFCIIRAGLTPRLATERLEGGESRLDKIIELIGACKYSIHDLSLAVSKRSNELFRMNMPFEFGLDLGRRRAPDEATNDKQFLVFEKNQYELKKCLSDIAGFDVEYHENDYLKAIEKLRNFLVVQADCALPGVSKIHGDYMTFQGWMTEKKIHEGHTEKEALRIPTQERLTEMKNWTELGRPDSFLPAN